VVAGVGGPHGDDPSLPPFLPPFLPPSLPPSHHTGLVVPLSPSSSEAATDGKQEEGREEGEGGREEGEEGPLSPPSPDLPPEDTPFMVEEGEVAALTPPSTIGGMPSYSLVNSTGTPSLPPPLPPSLPPSFRNPLLTSL
jgi:hypothetical protein